MLDRTATPVLALENGLAFPRRLPARFGIGDCVVVDGRVDPNELFERAGGLCVDWPRICVDWLCVDWPTLGVRLIGEAELNGFFGAVVGEATLLFNRFWIGDWSGERGAVLSGEKLWVEARFAGGRLVDRAGLVGIPMPPARFVLGLTAGAVERGDANGFDGADWGPLLEVVVARFVFNTGRLPKLLFDGGFAVGVRRLALNAGVCGDLVV